MTLSHLMPSHNRVRLRDVIADDLEIFFDQQQDPDARWMAAFTSKDAADHAAFMAHWARVLADTGIIVQTILFDGGVAGSVLVHGWFGDPEVSYWLGKAYWGRGIATSALTLFLGLVRTRPLSATAAKENAASQRVLAKCGFRVVGEGRGFANARGAEVEEVILRLDATPAITAFRGRHHFLSNFFPVALVWEQESYPTVEHAYQAAKTLDAAERQAIRQAATPLLAKQMGERCTLRPDWERIKLDIMASLLQQKFSQPLLRDQLLDTGDAELIEGNTWNDQFWGCVFVNGQWLGQNKIGKLLMRLRAELRVQVQDRTI